MCNALYPGTVYEPDLRLVLQVRELAVSDLSGRTWRFLLRKWVERAYAYNFNEGVGYILPLSR